MKKYLVLLMIVYLITPIAGGHTIWPLGSIFLFDFDVFYFPVLFGYLGLLLFIISLFAKQKRLVIYCILSLLFLYSSWLSSALYNADGSSGAPFFPYQLLLSFIFQITVVVFIVGLMKRRAAKPLHRTCTQQGRHANSEVARIKKKAKSILSATGFWQRPWKFKLPILVGISYLLLSTPLLINLTGSSIGNGDSPYHIIYSFINFSIIYYFTTGICQIYDFLSPTTIPYTENVILVIISWITWILFSSLIGIFFDLDKNKKPRDSEKKIEKKC